MAENSVRVEGHDGKFYEMDKGDAMDMLINCHHKAECLAALAPALHESCYDRNSPAVSGLADLLGELADDLGAVSKVLWTAQRQERGTEATTVVNDLLNSLQPTA